MSGHIPARDVQAVQELEGIAVLLESKNGPIVGMAVRQLKAAVAELIDSAAAVAAADRNGSLDDETVQRMRNALASVTGGAA